MTALWARVIVGGACLLPEFTILAVVCTFRQALCQNPAGPVHPGVACYRRSAGISEAYAKVCGALEEHITAHGVSYHFARMEAKPLALWALFGTTPDQRSSYVAEAVLLVGDSDIEPFMPLDHAVVKNGGQRDRWRSG